MLYNILREKRKRGAALIEISVVLFIIGLLASIFIINAITAKRNAVRSKALQSFDEIATAIYLYYNKYSDFPNRVGTSGYYFFDAGNPFGTPGTKPAFVPEFYPNWDAKFYCQNCYYKFEIYQNGCGYVMIYEPKSRGRGIGNLNFGYKQYMYKRNICNTSACNSTCGEIRVDPK